MIAPRVAPWAAALCTPLLFSQARAPHAHRAVPLHQGVRAVFNQVFLGGVLRMFSRMVCALCTLRILRVLYLLGLLVFGFVVIAIGSLLLGGEYPRGGIFALRVRMRFYHPMLAWLLRERCGA